MIKVIGTSGQISVGKEHAGKAVMIEEMEPGVWILKTGVFIPDAETWIHEKGVANNIEHAIRWAEKNPPRASDIDALLDKISRNA